jgi:hypothetical protein
MIDVYVPKQGLLTVIDQGSGIVGESWNPLRNEVLIDFEGNRYKAANIITYADRVARAYDRHQAHYPTVARMVVHAGSLTKVGTYDPALGGVTVYPGGAMADLAAWLAVDEVDLAELQVTR